MKVINIYPTHKKMTRAGGQADGGTKWKEKERKRKHTHHLRHLEKRKDMTIGQKNE